MHNAHSRFKLSVFLLYCSHGPAVIRSLPLLVDSAWKQIWYLSSTQHRLTQVLWSFVHFVSFFPKRVILFSGCKNPPHHLYMQCIHTHDDTSEPIFVLPGGLRICLFWRLPGTYNRLHEVDSIQIGRGVLCFR